MKLAWLLVQIAVIAGDPVRIEGPACFQGVLGRFYVIILTSATVGLLTKCVGLPTKWAATIEVQSAL